MKKTDSDLKKKIQFIKDKVDDLPYEDRLHILEILNQHLEPSQIIEHADGCRVNLNKLPDDIIFKLYHIVSVTLRKNKDNIII
jgi:hypothetical protein